MIKRYLPKPNNKSGSVGILAPLVLIVIVVAFGVRIAQWISPPSDPALLTPTKGLVRYIDEEHAPFNLPLPTNTFNSELKIIGHYPDGGPELTENSVVAVYVRDGWRFVEASYLPNTSVSAVTALFQQFPQETVVLSETTDAKLLNIKTFSDCLKAQSENGTGTCRFSHLLVFDLNGVVIRLAADGSHATQGELIEMAKSIVTSIDE